MGSAAIINPDLLRTTLWHSLRHRPCRQCMLLPTMTFGENPLYQEASFGVWCPGRCMSKVVTIPGYGGTFREAEAAQQVLARWWRRFAALRPVVVPVPEETFLVGLS